jgi:putative membrane protein
MTREDGGGGAAGESAGGAAGGRMGGAERDPRVYFAAERTMLAWVRTGIAMMGFGFVVARFGLFLRELAAGRAALAAGNPPAPSSGPTLSLWVGVALVVLGVCVNLAAAVRHFRFRARFERGEPFVTPRGLLIIVVSVLLAIIGVAMTLYLLVQGWN